MALYVKNNTIALELHSLKGREEALCVKLEIGKDKSICIDMIYRPPSQEEEVDGELIEDIYSIARHGELLLIGDFNISDVDCHIPAAVSSRSKEILDSLQGELFKQFVTDPTHEGAILDLVLTNGESVSDVIVGDHFISSDHQMLWFSIGTRLTESIQKRES